jgi:hypothetical protein
MLGSSQNAPSPNDLAAMELGREALRHVVDEVNRVFSEVVAPLQATLREAGYSPIPVGAPLRIGGGGS